MAKKKLKKKPVRNGAKVTQRRNAFEAAPIEAEDDEPEEETEEAEEGKKDEYGPIDAERAQAAFEAMFEQEKEIRRIEAKVDVAREELSRIVNDAKDAMGGRTGPFVLNGERVQLRTRGKTGYFTVETSKDLPSFDLGVERAARAGDKAAAE
jgi:hypothetical protein